MAREPLQSAGVPNLRLQGVCDLRRWLPDGGSFLRSCISRRPSWPRQSLLDLRQQSHHHRGQYKPDFYRRRRHALSGLRVERCPPPRPNDIEHIEATLIEPGKTQGRPILIILDSHIGYGSPHKQDSAEAHGEPLGEEEVRLTKRAYGWPENETFLVPENVYQRFAEGVGKRGSEARQSWTRLFDRYRAEYPDLANEVGLMQRRGLPERWDRNLPVFSPDSKGVAGRDTFRI